MSKAKLMQGNEAVAEGALAAGVAFMFYTLSQAAAIR